MHTIISLDVLSPSDSAIANHITAQGYTWTPCETPIKPLILCSASKGTLGIHGAIELSKAFQHTKR